MRINSKQRAVCACVVAAGLALGVSEALAAGKGGAGGPRMGVHRGPMAMPGPGAAGGHAPGSRPFARAGYGGFSAQAARYGEFGIYHRHNHYGCDSDACGGGYWGGGGVFYGEGYDDPNFEVGLAAGGAGYYDGYAYGRPAALTAAPPGAPEYALPGERVIEVPVTVTQTHIQAVEPQAANPHIIELKPTSCGPADCAPLNK